MGKLILTNGPDCVKTICIFQMWVKSAEKEMHGVRSHNAQTLQCGYCGRTFTCALCDLTPYAQFEIASDNKKEQVSGIR